MENENSLIAVANVLEIGDKLKNGQSYNEQFETLVLFIDYLLQNDFDRLMRILYRIDVTEQNVTLAITSGTDDNPASVQLAQMMIERELQKVKSRELYRKEREG